MDDLIEELRRRKKRVGDYYPFWRFRDAPDGSVKGNPVFVGRLLGSRPDPRNPNRKLFDVMTLDGQPYTLPSYAALTRALETVEPGTYVYIEYAGEGRAGRGGKKALLFEVATMTEEEVSELRSRVTVQKPQEAPKAEAKAESLREKAQRIVLTLLDFYGEVPEEKMRVALANAGIQIPLEDLCQAFGLRLEGGKVKR